MSLLESFPVSEVELVSYVQGIVPILFPSARPDTRAQINPSLPLDYYADLSFELASGRGIGIVELKRPSDDGSHALQRVQQIVGRLGPRVREAYIIAGRNTPAFHRAAPYGRRVAAPIQFLSWDQVVDQLVGSEPEPPEEPGDGPFTVLLVEIVEGTRRFLEHLCREPSLLSGIDDRRFEELITTMLFDIGFHNVELTKARGDGGFDVVAFHVSPSTRLWEKYLFECKHWVAGDTVSASIATTLLDLAKAEHAKGAFLVAPGGFGPKLLEQRGELQRKGLRLGDRGAVEHWFSLWEQQYGALLMTRVDPVKLLDQGLSGDGEL